MGTKSVSVWLVMMTFVAFSAVNLTADVVIKKSPKNLNVLKKLPLSKMKLVKHEGLAMAQSDKRNVEIVVMGDGKGQIDYGSSGVLYKWNAGAGLFSATHARIKGTIKLEKVVGRAKIWLSVNRDNSVPVTGTPEMLEVTAPGTYTLEVKKEFPVQAGHQYIAQFWVQVDQPGIHEIRAVAGEITKIEWIL